MFTVFFTESLLWEKDICYHKSKRTCVSAQVQIQKHALFPSSQKTQILFQFSLCHCQNKNTGLRQPQSQPSLSSNGLQKGDHTNVIPSDKSMCAGNEQLFDRSWGEYFITKIEHTHGTSTDIGCTVWLHFRGGYRGKHQEYLWPCAHNIVIHLHLFMVNFMLFTCTDHIFVFTPCF